MLKEFSSPFLENNGVAAPRQLPSPPMRRPPQPKQHGFPSTSSCTPALPGAEWSQQCSREVLPPPPLEMPPPPPPGFEASGGAEWPMLHSHFPSRPSIPAQSSGPPPPAVAPGVWGIGGLGAAVAAPGKHAGSWAPLSTNPGGMSSWLSTGVSECNSGALPVASGGLVHAACASGSTGSAHMSYPLQPAPAENSLPALSLWAAPSTAAPLVAPAGIMPSMTMAAPATMSSMQAEKPVTYRNQLRAEAAPYVPGGMSLGVQAC